VSLIVALDVEKKFSAFIMKGQGDQEEYLEFSALQNEGTGVLLKRLEPLINDTAPRSRKPEP